MSLIINKFYNYNNKISSNNVNKLRNAVTVCDGNKLVPIQIPTPIGKTEPNVNLITNNNVIYGVTATNVNQGDRVTIYDGDKEIIHIKSTTKNEIHSLNFNSGLRFVNEIGVFYTNDEEIFYANKD